jgi:hypothetical protein
MLESHVAGVKPPKKCLSGFAMSLSVVVSLTETQRWFQKELGSYWSPDFSRTV